MEKFIIYSKEYRDHYNRFTRYIAAIGYSPASCKTFNTSIREFLCWLEVKNIDALHVTESDIEGYYSHLQERPAVNGGVLSESRIVLNMYVTKLFYKQMQDDELIDMHPMNSLDYVRNYKRIRENLLTVDDIGVLYNACESSRQKAMLGILYGCGLRRLEAHRLNVTDVHFKSSMLYVREGKGGRKRSIPLSKSVLTDLKDYYYNERTEQLNHYGDPEAFLLNTLGKRISGDTLRMEVKKLVAKARLDSRITPHHFRHAIATHLLDSGMKTEHVKDFLGHMSIETTQTYTHITTSQMKRTTTYGAASIPA